MSDDNIPAGYSPEDLDNLRSALFSATQADAVATAIEDVASDLQCIIHERQCNTVALNVQRPQVAVAIILQLQALSDTIGRNTNRRARAFRY